MATQVGNNPINSWGYEDKQWESVEGGLHKHVSTGDVYLRTDAIRDFIKGAVFSYTATYFYGTLGLCRLAAAGAVYGNLLQSTRKPEEIAMQAGKELAVAFVFFAASYYYSIPTIAILAAAAFAPLQAKVVLNQVEDILNAKDRPSLNQAEMNSLNPLGIVHAIAKGSLTVPHLLGMNKEIPKQKEK